MSVKEHFKNKNIFITGGSGFVGKCLIEKILRTIPEIGSIYFLLRPKKGQTSQERLQKILDNEIFDLLKKTKADFFQKIIVIEGDAQQPKLGISSENRKILIENIDIIYHSAASVRFDDPLNSSILLNVRSTRDLIELAMEAQHLKAFVHVSTAFCNSDKKFVEEKLYPIRGDWQDAIKLAEEGNQDVTDILTQKYIHPLPNTYLYSKLLAEHVVNDLCVGKVPAVIVRPSVVTCAASEPIPGWLDNLNGPNGLYFAGGLGILRIILGDKNTYLDCVPVDAVANVLILTAYERMRNYCGNDVVEIFNNSLYDINNVTLQDAIDYGHELVQDVPLNGMIWYPFTRMTKYKSLYLISIILLHLIPAVVIDSLLVIYGKKARIFKIQKKIYIANSVIAPFMLNTWHFKNHKTLEIERRLTDEDVKTFGFTKMLRYAVENTKEYLRHGNFALQRKCFKTVDSKVNLKLLWRLWVLDIAAKILLGILLIFFLRKTNIGLMLYQCFVNILKIHGL